MSLAALHATYTDSEDEDEVIPNPSISIPSPDNSTTDSLIKSQKSRLVSYGEPGEDDDERADSSINISDELIVFSKEAAIANGYRQDEKAESINSESDSEDEHDIKLPPMPPAECSEQLQEKIAKLYAKKLHSNFNTITSIQSRKDFRNPSIYEKLISYCGIDELGTNYPMEMYDPHHWKKESFYDELSKAQKAIMEKREKEKKSKVEFASGTAKKSTESSDDTKKRKSKWDVVTENFGSKAESGSQTVVPPVVNSASGNKATVISAFGTISKKSK